MAYRLFFLFVGGWFVVYFANSRVITGSLMSILGVDIFDGGTAGKEVEASDA